MHAVGQQADGQDVVKVRVRDEDVIDARKLVQCEVAHTRARVDEHVVIKQKGCGAAAGGDGAGTTQNANLHGFAQSLIRLGTMPQKRLL